LRGIYAPVATIFHKDGELDLHRMVDNLKKLLHENPKMGGLVVLGSNGEYPSLNYEEKIKTLETVGRGMSHSQDHVYIAGTGANSTKETIELTARVADFGYSAAMVVTPYYYKPQMNDEALIKHFTAVANASPVPILLYNVPNFTGIDMSMKTIEKLAYHPNIIGIKESSGNITKTISLVALGKEVATKGGFFGVFAGSGGYYLPALSVGVHGGVFALANILAADLIHLHDLFERREISQAQRLQAALVNINQAITKDYGIPGLKAAMNLLLLHGGPPRSPLQSLELEGIDHIRTLLVNFFNFNMEIFGRKNHVLL